MAKYVIFGGNSAGWHRRGHSTGKDPKDAIRSWFVQEGGFESEKYDDWLAIPVNHFHHYTFYSRDPDENERLTKVNK